MTPPPTDKLEAETREEIDTKLEAAGWEIQDKKAMNLFAAEQGVHGVAVREVDTAQAQLITCFLLKTQNMGSSLAFCLEHKIWGQVLPFALSLIVGSSIRVKPIDSPKS